LEALDNKNGIITIKAGQWDALACENASLSHVGRFGEKAAQEHAIKAAKIKGSSMPSKTSESKPPISNSPRIPPASKGTNIASTSIPVPTNQKVDNKLKGTLEIEDKQVVLIPNNPDEKLQISDNLDPNRNSRSSLFSGRILMSLHGRYQIWLGSCNTLKFWKF
jgi:hypothetical protein